MMMYLVFDFQQDVVAHGLRQKHEVDTKNPHGTKHRPRPQRAGQAAAHVPLPTSLRRERGRKETKQTVAERVQRRS